VLARAGGRGGCSGRCGRCRRMTRKRGMGELGRPGVADVARDHQPLARLDRGGIADPVGVQDGVGRHVVAVRDAGDRLALSDDDRRAALPVPVAAARRRNRTGDVRRRRRRRRRLVLGRLIWSRPVLGQRLARDLSRRRRLDRCRLVRSRPSRVGIAVRILSETGGLRAACRSANGNRRQSPPTQRTMRTPPRFFTTHNRTHTQTPHHTDRQLNNTEVNISLNCRGLTKVSEILVRGRRGFDRPAPSRL
jgi:hypothetical protein